MKRTFRNRLTALVYLVLPLVPLALGCSTFSSRGAHAANDAPEEDLDIWEKMAPSHTYKELKKAVGQGPSESVGRQSYEEGMALFRQKQYDEAAKKFRISHKRWPDSVLEEEALFLEGECWFFADRYSKSEDAYGELIKKYPSTQYLDLVIRRRYQIAMFWQSLPEEFFLKPNFSDKTRPWFDTKGYAQKIYQRIRLDDPTGPLADDAVMRTATTFFEKRKFDDADYHFTLLRNEYPKSEHLYQAHILGLQAKLLRYQGPDYDGTPIKEADQLLKQIRLQFPEEKRTDETWLAKVDAELHSQLALRDFVRGEYYDKGEYYGASKQYYARVMQNYPETQLAKTSQEKIQQSAGKPQEPTPPLEWLVKMFPETRRDQMLTASAPGGTRR